MASVATMTGTLIDSGCKHIIPTRVSMDSLLDLTSAPDQNVLLRDKMRFCAHRMDLLLCVNKPIFPSSRGALTKHAAYPHVLSTLGDISQDVKDFIIEFYQEQGRFLQGGQFSTDKLSRYTTEAQNCIKKIPFFTFMGFSLGLGYAHPSSGDTVVSSMIGGMLSVQNGHFNVCTGDLLMWYFEFEDSQFDNEGRRRANAVDTVLDKGAMQRQSTHRRENGVFTEGPARERNTGKVNVAYPKPYLVCENTNIGSLDRSRVFAKAVSNARAFDKLDIIICTQSI